MSHLLNIFGEPQEFTPLYYLAGKKTSQLGSDHTRDLSPVLVKVKDPDVFWHLFSVYWWLVCLSYKLTPQGWSHQEPKQHTISQRQSDLELLLLEVVDSEDAGVQSLLLHGNLVRYFPNENVAFCPCAHPFETKMPKTTSRPNLASNVLEWYPITPEGKVDHSRPMIEIVYFGEWNSSHRKEG